MVDGVVLFGIGGFGIGFGVGDEDWWKGEEVIVCGGDDIWLGWVNIFWGGEYGGGDL